MRPLIYRFLNTGIGRRIRAGVDSHMREHPYWSEIKGIKLKYASASDLDVNKQAMHKGLGYDAEWILSRDIHTLIDLGCHTGLFPLWLAAQNRRVTPTGLAIDGNPAMCDRAAEHFRANFITMKVVHGLVGETGDGVIHTHPVTVSSSAIMDDRAWGGKTVSVPAPCVEVARLWPGTDMFDLLKVDIEGSEFGFFLNEWAFCSRARRIVVEWHEPQCSLTWIRDRLYLSHRLVKFSQHKWIGYAYFDHV